MKLRAAADLARAGGERASPQPQVVYCIGILGFAFLLRCMSLDKQSLWVDEFFTFYWSRLDLGFLLGDGAHVESTPPAYYLLMHAWTHVFGGSEASLRFPSVLFSAATVWVVYALSRMMFERRTAVLAAFFAAIEPAAVYYAQEARSYALLGLTDSLVILSLAGYARDREAQDVRRWPWLVLFVCASVGAMSVHYTSVALVAACFATIGVDLITTRPLPVRESLRWCVVGIVVAVCSLPVLALARGLAARPDLLSISWIPKPAFAGLRDFFLAQLSASAPSGNLVTLLLGAPLIVIVCSASPWTRLNRTQFGLLILLPAIYCLFVVGVSFWRPILLGRTGIWLTIPLCVLLARGVALQPTAWRRSVVAATGSAVFLGALGHYFFFHRKEDWRGAARIVASEPKCTGPVVFTQAYALGLIYYEPGLSSRPLTQLKMPDSDPATNSPYVLASKILHADSLPVGQLGTFLRDHRNAVLVLRAHNRPLLDALGTARFFAALPGGVLVSCF